MAARGPRTTFSALRALGALGVVILFFGSVVLFGYVIADFLGEQADDNPDDSTPGGADDPEESDEGSDNGTVTDNQTGAETDQPDNFG